MESRQVRGVLGRAAAVLFQDTQLDHRGVVGVASVFKALLHFIDQIIPLFLTLPRTQTTDGLECHKIGRVNHLVH